MSPRLKALLSCFRREKIDAILVSSCPNVSYLSGFKGAESWLFVSSKGLYFITDSRYFEQARVEAKGFTVVLRGNQSVTDITADLAKKTHAKKVGFEASHVTYTFHTALVRSFGSGRLKPTFGLVEALREIKDDFEASLIRRSVEIAVRGFHYIRESVRPGMTERGVQGRLEYYIKSIGSERPAFDIIIAAGSRASMPHCQSNKTPIRNNDSVLVDMGTVYEGYHSDLTRPIFLGKMSPLHQKVYNVVWEAQRAGIRMAGPGIPARLVDKACRDFIAKAGYADYFGHGTGHGVGLEVHEAPTVSPRSQTILKPGMVITVEPGVYLPGKLGIRIEDMVLITEKGHEVLTAGLERK